MANFRVYVVGGRITVGIGDGLRRGWPGRAGVASVERGYDAKLCREGVRADTSELIRARRPAECAPQPPRNINGELVVAFRG